MDTAHRGGGTAGDVVVSAQGLTKRFGATRVLDGIDLELRRGEVLALLGPNGAGKTTTVRILATLLRPDAGSVSVWGHDVVREARRVRDLISLTGQFAAVDEKLTGAENLVMMGRLAHLPRRAVAPRAAELLDAFGLTDAADRRVETYSGGMRRRLDLAAGLLGRPSVIFLDEPTTGLDPRSRQAMWDVIRDVVANGASLFLTTQYLEEADRLADRIALLDDGGIVAEGTAAQLKARVGEASVEIVTGGADDGARLAHVFGVTPIGATVRVPTDGSVGHVRDVLDAVDGAGVAVERWDVRTPSLDDVFLALTGHAARTRPDAGSATSTTDEQDRTEVAA
ncbi:daunorubicin resistance ABC transporter ATPase subunit [Beutenbergia cavernae DSM 12333]|uniref:Daunorubicin resistance ABC transporter ATPase subunit n=1 Tax=Beutenbergia cavernae (strain ATCC BAA-8 / DSM 12333 / CCUG 43141 / JCM 11478 / NBRC 16432 / NCIMB 13614 / HKI 0122) TaxID=471853 RepID=C5BY41_BEUC1|nr:daunorubicin resistance protein DrrA family ABC transporter ATP-binding protein [Beutenbergia cavernae]ACQ78935.1 daunorubicin resistance ABC transporter ATPase subunit [Beutenbergia cavernae DSM 12333]